MKQIFKLLCLILIIAISCRNRNDNKINPSFVGEKTNNTDSTVFRKSAQDNFIIDSTLKQGDEKVYMYCEKMAEFPGGKAAFNNYMMKNIKYPLAAVSDSIQGRVILKFVIKSDGKVGNIVLIRGIRSDLDNECLKALSGMPDWKPGIIDEKPVAVSFSIPVRFLFKNTGNMNGIYILPTRNNSAFKRLN